MKVLQETQNPLFNRKEIVFEIESQASPSNKEVEEIISKEFKTSPEAFKLKKIDSKFGSRTFKVSVNIYPSKEDKEEIEFKSKKEKELEKKMAEEAAAKAAEAKKAEEEAKAKELEEKQKAEEATEEKKDEPSEEKPTEESKPEEKKE